MSIREQQIGVLKVIECLAAIIFVVGAIAWGWYPTLFLWLILAALPYTVLRVRRNLEQETERSRRLRQTVVKEKTGSQEQTSGRPVNTATTQHSKSRVDPQDIQTTVALEQKGILHESVECSTA